jgi:hypothetical protein
VYSRPFVRCELHREASNSSRCTAVRASFCAHRSLPAPKCFLSQLGEFSVFLARLLAESRFLAPQGEHRT